MVVDNQTMYFISLLNGLAEKTKKGFVPLSQCLTDTIANTFIVYDDVMDVDLFYSKGRYLGDGFVYPVILDVCLTPERKDVVSYYENKYGCSVNVIVEDEETYLSLTTSDLDIEIKGGIWEIVNH